MFKNVKLLFAMAFGVFYFGIGGENDSANAWEAKDCLEAERNCSHFGCEAFSSKKETFKYCKHNLCSDDWTGFKACSEKIDQIHNLAVQLERTFV